jgi:hypothetical protein
MKLQLVLIPTFNLAHDLVHRLVDDFNRIFRVIVHFSLFVYLLGYDAFLPLPSSFGTEGVHSVKSHLDRRPSVAALVKSFVFIISLILLLQEGVF